MSSINWIIFPNRIPHHLGLDVAAPVVQLFAIENGSHISSGVARGDGVWLLTFKTDSGHPHLGYDAAVEEAFCFGTVDARHSKLWFAPRKAGT